MTSLPAVPHSLPPLARLARSPRAPSSPPPGPLAASPARPPAGTLGGGGRRGGGGHACSPGRPGPSPEPQGPDDRGRPGAPAERRRHLLGACTGTQVSGRAAAGPENLSPPLPRQRRPRPRRPPARLAASRSFLGPRPPRLLGPPSAKLSLFSSLSPPPAPPPLQPVGGAGTS